MDILSDLAGWFESLFDNVTSIGIGYLIVGCLFQFGGTLLNSVAWRNVLQAAYPDTPIKQSEISAAYAGGVALNSALPSQIGTITYLALFRATIPGSSITTIISGAAVQAIFWTIVGAIVYLILFLGAPASFEEELGSLWTWMGDHVGLTLLIAAAIVGLLVLAVLAIRARLRRQWAQMGEGAAILRTPRKYLSRVVLFQALSYACRIGVNSTFMAAYDIPVTARNVFIVISAASIASVVSVAPGAVGATTAVLLVALSGQATQDQITSYSVGQQSITLLANMGLGLLLMIRVYGWEATHSLMKRKKKDKSQTTEQQADALADEIARGRAERAERSGNPPP